MSGGTFAELFCEVEGLDLGDYREAVLDRTLYMRARMLRPLLKSEMHYFSADYEFVEGVGQIRSRDQLEAEIRSYLDHPANTGFRRRHLKLRVSIRRMQDLVNATLREPGPSAAPPATPPPPKADPGLRVLLVDDNRVTQGFMQLRLGRLGCTVITADNGAEALKQIELARFDLIIMDHQMPVMNGAQAAVRIRREEASRRAAGQHFVPLYLASFAASPADRAEDLAAGMDDHLGKPVEDEQLTALLARAARARPIG